MFIGRTDAEAETPILWPPDVRNQLIRKDPDAGKDWRQEEKGTTEDEMVGWHHWLDGHEFEQALGVGDGQGSLVSMGSPGCSPWGRKESDTTEQLNWTELNLNLPYKSILSKELPSFWNNQGKRQKDVDGCLLVKSPQRGKEDLSHRIPFNDFHVAVTLCLDQSPRTKETDLVLLELSVVESHLSLPHRDFFF